MQLLAEAVLALLLVTWLKLGRPVALKVSGNYLGIALVRNLTVVWWTRSG